MCRHRYLFSIPRDGIFSAFGYVQEEKKKKKRRCTSLEHVLYIAFTPTGAGCMQGAAVSLN